MLKLPENFQSYGDARRAGFMRLKEAKENGARVVGVYCSFVPHELILAAGASAVPLCATSEEPIAAAEADLPRNLCPLIKASYGFAKTDTCPYFYFSDFIVGETTCDGKKKMFELLNDIKETYVLQLPSSRNAAALELWKKELIAFKEKLESFYHITITDDDIRQAIRRKNRERKVMKTFFELGTLNPAPISGYELSTRTDSSGFELNIDKRCEAIEERIAQVQEDGRANVGRLGADVVAFDSCSGVREKIELVDETMPVMDALAKKYLNINCSVMSPNNTRIEYIGEMIEEYAIAGDWKLYCRLAIPSMWNPIW